MSSYYVPDPANPYKPWVAPANPNDPNSPYYVPPVDPNEPVPPITYPTGGPTSPGVVPLDPGLPSVPAGANGQPPVTTTTTTPATAAQLSAWYQNWLANDPTLQAVLAGINATGSAYKGQLSNEEAQLLEQYGAVPTGASQYAPFIDSTVAGIANAATQGGVSTLAQLARAYAQQQQSTLDSLAARGMLRSGATGVRENNDLQNENVAQYNALQKVLQSLGTNYSTYLGQQDQLGQESATAQSTAMQRLTDLINNGTITAPTTVTTSTTTPKGTNPTLPTPAAPSVGTAIQSNSPGPSPTPSAAPNPAPAAPLSQIHTPGVQL